MNVAELAEQRPVLWGLASGVLFGSVGLALFGVLWLAAVVALPFGALNWWLWRSGGPGHRWRASMLRRFPPH